MYTDMVPKISYQFLIGNVYLGKGKNGYITSTDCVNSL